MKKGGFLRNVLDGLRSTQGGGQSSGSFGSSSGGGAGPNSGSFSGSGPHDTFEGTQLRPNHFALATVARHGFPYEPTAIDHDPIQRIVAVGTKTGALRVFGRPGVDLHGQHLPEYAVLHIKFLVNQGLLITVTADDSIHLWSLRGVTLHQVPSSGAMGSSSGSSSGSPASVEHSHHLSSTSSASVHQEHTSANKQPTAVVSKQPEILHTLKFQREHITYIDKSTSCTSSSSSSVSFASGVINLTSSAAAQTAAVAAGAVGQSSGASLSGSASGAGPSSSSTGPTSIGGGGVTSGAGGQSSPTSGPANKWLYIGTERGNVHIVNVDTFQLSGYVINWNKAIELSRRTHPGAIVHVSECPHDTNRLLIGYESGYICLWNLERRAPDQRYYYGPSETLMHITWQYDGKHFMASHADGSLLGWSVRSSARPTLVLHPHSRPSSKAQYQDSMSSQGETCPPTSTGAASQQTETYQPIAKCEYRMAKNSEVFIIFSGGLPHEVAATNSQNNNYVAGANNYANYEPSLKSTTLTVMLGKSIAVLEMDALIVDFVLICEPPFHTSADCVDPIVACVLLVNDLVLIDLTSVGYPSFRCPYGAMSLHESRVTCCHYVADCASDLIPAIYSTSSSSSLASGGGSSSSSSTCQSSAGQVLSAQSISSQSNLHTNQQQISNQQQQQSSQQQQQQQQRAHKQRKGYTDKEWPIDGGEWGQNLQSYPELVITGHADGSLRFWDISGTNFDPITRLRTDRLFDRPIVGPQTTSVNSAGGAGATKRATPTPPVVGGAGGGGTNATQPSNILGSLRCVCGAQFAPHAIHPLHASTNGTANANSMGNGTAHQSANQSNNNQANNGNNTRGAPIGMPLIWASNVDENNENERIEERNCRQRQSMSSMTQSIDYFAITNIELNTKTKHLIVGGASGQIVLYRFARKESTADVSLVELELPNGLDSYYLTASSPVSSRSPLPPPPPPSSCQASSTAAAGNLINNNNNNELTTTTTAAATSTTTSVHYVVQARRGHQRHALGFQAELICVAPWLVAVPPLSSSSSSLSSSSEIQQSTTTSDNQLGYYVAPCALVSLAYNAHHQLLAFAYSNAVVIVDCVQKCSVLNANVHELYGPNGVNLATPSPVMPIQHLSSGGAKSATSSATSGNSNLPSSTPSSQFASPYRNVGQMQRQMSTTTLRSSSPVVTSGSQQQSTSTTTAPLTTQAPIASEQRQQQQNNESSQQQTTASVAAGSAASQAPAARRLYQRQMTATQLTASSSFGSPQQRQKSGQQQQQQQQQSQLCGSGERLAGAASASCLANINSLSSSSSQQQQQQQQQQHHHHQHLNKRSVTPTDEQMFASINTNSNNNTNQQTTPAPPHKVSANKRIISRMLSIHTIGGGGEDSSLSLSASQLASAAANAFSSSADKFDASFTRSRSSSCSSINEQQTHANVECVECIAFVTAASGASNAAGQQQQQQQPGNEFISLWVGTSHGNTMCVTLTMPDSDDNRVLQLQSVLANPHEVGVLRTPGAVKCLSSFTKQEPSTTSTHNNNDDDSAMESTIPHTSVNYIVVASEKQAKVAQFVIPNQTTTTSSSRHSSQHGHSSSSNNNSGNQISIVARVKLSDTSYACKSRVIPWRQPDHEFCLVTYLATGNILIHSLPKLKLLFDADFVPFSNRTAETIAFSNNGHGLYMSSPREITKFTFSSSYKSLVNEMLGSAYVPREMPEMPKQNFFKSLFSSGPKASDRDELFAEAGKASRSVARHIPGSAGLERLKGQAHGSMGHEMRMAREGLDERGEKLGELEDKTLAMMNSADSYSKSAHELVQKFKDKKWYQF